MTSEQLRKTRDAVPFVPFTINMTDGRTYRVVHRDFVLITNGRIVIVHQPETDAVDILDIMLMSSLSLDSNPIQPVAAGVDGV